MFNGINALRLSITDRYFISHTFSSYDQFRTHSLAVGRTNGHSELAKDPPLVNLFSLKPVLTLVSIVFVHGCFQALTFVHMQQQVW